MSIIRREFDFEGEEMVAVMEAVTLYIIYLEQMPPSQKREATKAALGRFLDKVKPIAEEGLQQALRRARLN